MDDEPDLREIYGFWLDAANCTRYYTAANGEEALTRLKTTHIDALVSDIRMPVMDGIALVRCVANLAQPVPCIIFVTGCGDVDQREMYSLGVEAFLVKGLDRADFIRVLQNVLEERSDLWLTPLAKVPRQSLIIHSEELRGTHGANSIHLGRGGFSAHTDEPLTLGNVSFQCHFSSGRAAMSGQGLVRWYSRSDQAVGIEFAFLDPSCRSWVLDEIAAANPRGFITNLSEGAMKMPSIGAL